MKLSRLPRRLTNYVRYWKTTADRPQHNDVYIVEFPKSGISWLSAILANMALISSGRKEMASFTATGLFVPDIHVTRHIGKMVYDVPPVRMIKSHAEFNPNYAFVIYLARRPVDVMKSYFRFNRENSGPEFSSFDDFCRSESVGIPAWKRHVRSWFDGEVIAQRVHLCRYEDLLANAVHEVSEISSNFGWNIDLDAIEAAVEASSVDQMRESEALYRSRNPRYTMSFVRGKADFVVEEKTISYIESTCMEEVRLLGYR